MFQPFSSRINRRTLVQAAAASAVATSLPANSHAAQDRTAVTLALDWYPNANHAGLYMAVANGYFEDAGIDLEIFVPADPTTVLQTVGAGRDTFGITYQNDVLLARANDVPIQSIAAVVQHPLNCVMVLADSDIQSPADLAGKTIAIAGVPTDDALLQTVLGSVDLTLDDVEIVNVGFDLMPALLSERADALIGVYWTHETILAENQGYPVRYFPIQEYGVPDYYELVIVAGESTIADQPEAVTAFLGALRRGYVDAAADLDTALQHLIAESPELVEDVEREGLDLLAPLWTDNGKVPWGTQTADRWEAYTEWAQGEGLIPDDVVAADAWIDLFPQDDATPVASPEN